MHAIPTEVRRLDHLGRVGPWRDLADLTARIAEVLHGPLVVVSPHHAPLAAAGAGASTLAERLGEDPARAALRLAARSPQPVRIGGGRDDVVVALRVGVTGDHLGYLATLLPAGRADVAFEVLREAATVIAIELLVEERICRAVEADEREVFLDLVEGRALVRIAPRASRLGFDLARPHIPLVCRSAPPAVPSSLDRLPAALMEALVESFSASTGGGVPRPLIGHLGERELLAFLPTSDERLAESVGAAVLQRTEALGRPVTIGIGRPCDSPETFSENTARARWAAEILELGALAGSMASFDHLGVYALLFQADHAGELDKFIRRWIGVLIDYDTRRHADLTNTLAVFLEGRGLRQAASRLMIHVSTLKYRIKRINEILALDYHDPEINFNLQLALRLHKVTPARTSRLSAIP